MASDEDGIREGVVLWWCGGVVVWCSPQYAGRQEIKLHIHVTKLEGKGKEEVKYAGVMIRVRKYVFSFPRKCTKFNESGFSTYK